jgi:hypothetical protein
MEHIVGCGRGCLQPRRVNNGSIRLALWPTLAVAVAGRRARKQPALVRTCVRACVPPSSPEEIEALWVNSPCHHPLLMLLQQQRQGDAHRQWPLCAPPPPTAGGERRCLRLVSFAQVAACLDRCAGCEDGRPTQVAPLEWGGSVGLLCAAYTMKLFRVVVWWLARERTPS